MNGFDMDFTDVIVIITSTSTGIGKEMLIRLPLINLP